MSLKITVSHTTLWVSSAVLHCEGPLDQESYRALVDLALEEMEKGAADITVDLTEVPSINLAGVVGLYLTGLLLEEEAQELVEPLRQQRDWERVDGWQVLHQFCEAVAAGAQLAHIRLLVPNQGLMEQITAIGLNRLMQVLPKFGDLEEVAKYL